MNIITELSKLLDCDNPEQLAKKTGIPPATLYRLSKDDANPLPVVQRLLCGLYQALMTDKEEREGIAKAMRDNDFYTKP